MADNKKCPFCERENAMIRLRVSATGRRAQRGDYNLTANDPLKGPQGLVFLWICQHCGRSVVRK